MDEVKAIAAKILDECATRICANMARHYRTTAGERWINASGRSAEAFQVVTEGDGGTLIRLVYRGDGVAPLDSIQYGSDEVPTIEEAARWRDEKMRSGAKKMPSAKAIVRGIRERGGTERHFEPQEWIIGPEVEAAVEALNDQLPASAVRAVRDLLFSR